MAEESTSSKVWVVVDGEAPDAALGLPPNDDEFEAQAGRLKALLGGKAKELEFSQVQDQWNERLDQVEALALAADAKAGANADGKTGLRLTQIELGLTITAQGHLAFVASASASATFKVTFTRK